jgi:hypothetical protein
LFHLVENLAFIYQRLETKTGNFELKPRGGEGAAMKESNTLSTMPAIRPFRAVPLPLDVLIEVPDVRGYRMERGRTRSPGRAATSWTRHARTKRRLRREVRMAGCVLLALMPIVSACTTGWSSRPDRVVACSIGDTAPEHENLAAFSAHERTLERGGNVVESNGPVVLSVEPAGVVPGNDKVVPVVFPGYLLPVDSLEDAAHEGS